LQSEVQDLRGANSLLATEKMAQKQEIDALLKLHEELVARVAKSKSEDAIKRILHEFRTLRKHNYAFHPRKQFPIQQPETSLAHRETVQCIKFFSHSCCHNLSSLNAKLMPGPD
jgi:hypothetical protein